VEAIKNNHVPSKVGVYKSLGYRVIKTVSKLKPEFLNLPSLEIKNKIETLGKAATHTDIETILLSYSGDTPCENFKYWDNSKILIHEATFLGGDEDKNIQTHGNRHSNLEEVIKSVAESTIECLILGHFSSRYSNDQIDSRIIEFCMKYEIKIPVYRILPGLVTRNIFNGSKIF